MVGNYPNDTSELPDSFKTKAVLSTTRASSTQLHHDLDTDFTELFIGISVVRLDAQCDRGVKRQILTNYIANALAVAMLRI